MTVHNRGSLPVAWFSLHRGGVSPREFQRIAQGSPFVRERTSVLERKYPLFFLQHLREQVQEKDFQSLLDRVTFGMEVSKSLLVKRLIVREFTSLSNLSAYRQSSEWNETVRSFLSPGEPPASMSVEEYLKCRTWSDIPFTRLPRPAYAEPEESGMAQMFLIMALHNAIKEAVLAVEE